MRKNKLLIGLTAEENQMVLDEFSVIDESINVINNIKDIDKVVYDSLEELTISHNDYLKKIKEYEKKLTKEEVIMLLESV
mgnify:CR=1 FL=1